jgi:valyl-tRNA synthetase
MFSKKLASPAFVDRAPAEIVAKERQKLAEVVGKKQVLEESLDKIRKLK